MPTFGLCRLVDVAPCQGSLLAVLLGIFLQGGEPGEDVGFGLADAGGGVGGSGLVDGCLFDGHVGVEVGVGAGGVLVTEPERDDGDVDSGVEQVHRGGVPQGVHGDVLVGQARAGVGGRGEVFG